VAPRNASFGKDNRGDFNLPSIPADPLPSLLSQTGVFRDLAELTPDPAFVPYELNVPFWSDGAAKRRWIAVPNGKHIEFAADEPWGFPAGTLLLKHFELPAIGSTPARRLETRLLLCDGQGGVRGASYKWNADGTNAELVSAPAVEEIALDGPGPHRWYFPGPDDCRKCHLPAAGGVLGVNTRQLNRDISSGGGIANQLRLLQEAGLLEGFVASDLAHLPKLPRLDDPRAAPEERARSFLDANCAHCHRPGGAVADFDARYATPLERQNLIGARPRIDFGIDRARFVAPNDPWRSMVLVRAGMLGQSGMPPLAHEAIDPQGVTVLREWIESLPGPPTLAPPVIERLDESPNGPVRVAIRHDDPQAVLRYTLDGSAPGKSSPAYAGPIELTGPTTVRARAERPDRNRSIAVHATFVPGE
jgi:uncharacterized repeat protein (TIGR03806 family)